MRTINTVLAASLLLGFMSSANAAIQISTATIQEGQVYIEGNQALRRATILWEGADLGLLTTPGGSFAFATAIRPGDCIGRLNIGSEQRDVVVSNCTPTPIFNATTAKTGQTLSQAAGDDGDLERGVAWPTQRFTDNFNGTITDRLTGLFWLRDANCPVLSPNTWLGALEAIANLGHGLCGLSDFSVPGDWRLPNRNELQSLLDLSRQNPALPSGHLFLNFQASYYWTSSSHEFFPDVYFAWLVDFNRGIVDFGGFGDYVIAVRRGP